MSGTPAAEIGPERQPLRSAPGNRIKRYLCPIVLIQKDMFVLIQGCPVLRAGSTASTGQLQRQQLERQRRQVTSGGTSAAEAGRQRRQVGSGGRSAAEAGRQRRRVGSRGGSAAEAGRQQRRVGFVACVVSPLWHNGKRKKCASVLLSHYPNFPGVCP